MNAAERALIEQAAKETATALIPALVELQVMAYYRGLEAGRIEGNEKGIEIGKATAAGLISGLRQLLGMAEGGAVPAGLPPMVTNDQVVDPITAGRIAEAGRTIVGAPLEKTAKIENILLGRELVDLATGEIFEAGAGDNILEVLNEVVEDHDREIEEAAERSEAERSEKVLADHPAVNFPGYFPLDVPLGDCVVCEGLGTVQGELYGAPCLVPCMLCPAGAKVSEIGATELAGNADAFDSFAEAISTAEAAAQVEDFPEVQVPGELADGGIGEATRKAEELGLVVGEAGPVTVCINQACVNYSQEKANCDNPATPKLCTEATTLTRPAELPAIKCFNAGCQFYDDTYTDGCKVPALSRDGHPLSDCPDYQAVPSPSGGESTLPECCRVCPVEDPDCSSCHLVDQAKAPTSSPDVAKCASGPCTATGKNPKDVCLRVGTDKRPPRDCKGFIPVEACKCSNPHKQTKNPDGSTSCDLCDKVIAPAPTPAAGAPSPAPEGGNQGAAAPDAADEKKKRLQARCTHPVDFMSVIPGRGEVCTICDLTLTPETLPLPGVLVTGQTDVVEEEIPLVDAGKVVEIYQGTGAAKEELAGEGDECDHLPLDVRYTEPVLDPESGEQIGERELCGLCGEEIPPEAAAPVKECDHPVDLRFPAPVMENGQKVGSLIKCGECDQVIARFDNERKPIPRELWPENGGNIEQADIRKHGYKPAELKMIKAGFSLIRYDRDNKDVYKTCKDPALGRFLVIHGKTYADCERRLAEELKDTKLVQVDADGNAADRHAEAKLRAAGFEFYRMEKGSEGVSPKIKVGSKNWGMLAKYKDDAELTTAWKKLMDEDPLALQG